MTGILGIEEWKKHVAIRNVKKTGILTIIFDLPEVKRPAVPVPGKNPCGSRF
jgi:hypothetical protein